MIPLGAALLDPDRRVLHGPAASGETKLSPEVDLAPNVARLLGLLGRRPGEVLPYAEILAACYVGARCRAGDGGTGALKVQLHRARHALRAAGAGVDITTVKMVGLSLDAGPELVVRTYTPEQAAAADAAVERLRSPEAAAPAREPAA